MKLSTPSIHGTAPATGQDCAQSSEHAPGSRTQPTETQSRISGALRNLPKRPTSNRSAESRPDAGSRRASTPNQPASAYSMDAPEHAEAYPNISVAGEFGHDASRYSNALQMYCEADRRVRAPLVDTIQQHGKDIELEFSTSNRMPPSRAGNTGASVNGVGVHTDPAALAQHIAAGHPLSLSVQVNENHVLTRNSGYGAHVIDHEMSLHVAPIVDVFLEARTMAAQGNEGAVAEFIRGEQADGGRLNADTHHRSLAQIRPDRLPDAHTERLVKTHVELLSGADDDTVRSQIGDAMRADVTVHQRNNS
ncbi:hypothetical protein [Burkholderia gladioli]|uniref:hypothetical protein n=1 Tax=Burkholderia gladioli TaxID=28095 RepID=UPI0022D175F3|nr:hypothetical protein [Burkholderia gladioli]MDA0569996.1 hypothetical protein [Burkholderia gladioli]MDA0598184.1 hypothetical protein [Burkholderia gladioli]